MIVSSFMKVCITMRFKFLQQEEQVADGNHLWIFQLLSFTFNNLQTLQTLLFAGVVRLCFINVIGLFLCKNRTNCLLNILHLLTFIKLLVDYPLNVQIDILELFELVLHFCLYSIVELPILFIVYQNFVPSYWLILRDSASCSSDLAFMYCLK